MNYLNFDSKIEPIGTMERYVVSPYSAEGGNYYNVDADSTILLNNLKKIHADSVKAVTESKRIFELTKQTFERARTEALDCKARRDAKNNGVSKNNACHIDDLTDANKFWADAEFGLQTETTKLNDSLNNLKTATDNLNIALENEKKQENSTPKKIIALNQAQKDLELSTNKSKKDAEVLLAKTKFESDALVIKTKSDAELLIIKTKNKKIIVLILGTLLIVGGIVAYIKFKK